MDVRYAPRQVSISEEDIQSLGTQTAGVPSCCMGSSCVSPGKYIHCSEDTPERLRVRIAGQ